LHRPPLPNRPKKCHEVDIKRSVTWFRHAGTVALRYAWVRQGGGRRISIQMGAMGKVLLVLAVLIIVAIVGGGLFLAYSPPSAPTQKVEKVLPDARFPH
jgi:hypothetical protein